MTPLFVQLSPSYVTKRPAPLLSNFLIYAYQSPSMTTLYVSHCPSTMMLLYRSEWSNQWLHYKMSKRGRSNIKPLVPHQANVFFTPTLLTCHQKNCILRPYYTYGVNSVTKWVQVSFAELNRFFTVDGFVRAQREVVKVEYLRRCATFCLFSRGSQQLIEFYKHHEKLQLLRGLLLCIIIAVSTIAQLIYYLFTVAEATAIPVRKAITSLENENYKYFIC